MTDTLESLATILVEAVEPLRKAVSDLPSFRTFLQRLGWRVESLPAEYQELGAQVTQALNSLEALRNGNIDVGTVLDNIKGLYQAIQGISAAPSGVDEAAFLADLQSSLFDLLVTDYLARHRPVLFNTLRLTGAIVREYRPSPGNGFPSFVNRLRLGELRRLLDDPRTAVGNALGWGTPSFDFNLLVEFLGALIAGLRVSSSISPVPDDLAAGFQRDAADAPNAPIQEQLTIRFLDVELAGERGFLGVSLLALPAEGSKLPGILIQPVLPVGIPPEISAGDFVKIVIRSGSQLGGAFGVAIEPDGISVRYPFDPNGEVPPGGFGASVVYHTAEEITLLGRRDRANVSFTGATASVTLDRSPADTDFKVSFSLDGLKVSIPAGEGDSFLKRITGGSGATVPIQFQIQWSSRTGLGISGGAGFEFSSATYVSLGPISINKISFAVRTTITSGAPPDLTLTAGVSMTAALGPLTVVLDDIGVRATVVVQDGNTGPFDVSAGFKAPDGLGLVVDAGPVTGGGFLSFDSETGQYAGAAELEVYEISVKAIGFLDTRIPGGSPSYSFFLLVAADFAPIQLGFGFTLNGIVGLAGIHRTINVDELRNRFRNGTLNNIFFEPDPVKNAARLVTDLRAVFPPAENRYVFGPMAIVGWGTPTLIEGQLAVILELPQPVRLIILAFLHIALPRKDAALITINLDLLGEIDPERQRISLDGRLRESYVFGFPIEGEMAMRLQGGPQRNFALAIGGFNPGYKPPPGFPGLKRITIPIGIDGNPRVTIEGYLALTSNTLQVGASASLYAEAGWFNITGSIEFHALFTFFPFSFITDFCGRVTLREGSNDLAGIKLEAKISGITPWRAAGEACLEIRWFPDICVGFDASFGDELAIESLILDPFPVLRDAFQKIENWSGVRPAGVFRSATIGTPSGSPVTLFDPAFGASVRQTVVPLSRTITKFGEAQPPGGSARFDVASVTTAGTGAGDVGPVQEFFAPAQFEEMTNDDKLSRPSFEKMDSGISFAQDAISHGTGVLAEVEFETKIIDSTVQTRRFGSFFPSRQLQVAAARRVSFARQFVDRSGKSKFAPPPAQPPLAVLNDESFVIASTVDLSLQSELAEASTKGAVFQALDAWLDAHPQDRARLQVMSVAELGGGG